MCFKRYAPKTTSKIPINFVLVGTSWIVKAAIIVVNTGLKDDIGERIEMAD